MTWLPSYSGDGTVTPNPLSLSKAVFEDDFTCNKDGVRTPHEVITSSVPFAKDLHKKLHQLLQSDEGGQPLPIPPPPSVHEVPRPGLVTRQALEKEDTSTSVGSAGHPFSCSVACKYVKRKGGCRDGASCLKCHQCFWSRTAEREVEHQGVSAPFLNLLALESQLTGALYLSEASRTQFQPSRGSIGHPTTCGTACKYIRRKGGCRDGQDCPNCHLCHWQRSMQATKQINSKADVLKQSTFRRADLVTSPFGSAPPGLEAELPRRAQISTGPFYSCTSLKQEDRTELPSTIRFQMVPQEFSHHSTGPGPVSAHGLIDGIKAEWLRHTDRDPRIAGGFRQMANLVGPILLHF